MKSGLTNLEKRTRGDPIEASYISYDIDYDWKGSNIGTQVLINQYGKQNQRTRIQAI